MLESALKAVSWVPDTHMFCQDGVPTIYQGMPSEQVWAVLRRSDHYSRAGSSSAEQWMTSLTVHGSHIPGSCWAPFPASSWATGEAAA